MLWINVVVVAAILSMYWRQAGMAADTIRQGPFSCKPVTQIRFAQNRIATRFDGSIQRWQQACFSFAARKGQHLKLDLVDFNQSVGLAVYRPGYSIEYGNYTDDGKHVGGRGTERFPRNTYGGTTLTPPPEAQTTPITARSHVQTTDASHLPTCCDVISHGAAASNWLRPHSPVSPPEGPPTP